MDEKTYKEWWQLHLRAVMGETLNPDEQTEYNAGMRELDEEEREQLHSNSLVALRQVRTQIEKLQDAQAELREESVHLDKKISSLEKTYQALTGYMLAAEPYGAP